MDKKNFFKKNTAWTINEKHNSFGKARILILCQDVLKDSNKILLNIYRDNKKLILKFNDFDYSVINIHGIYKKCGDRLYEKVPKCRNDDHRLCPKPCQ